MKILSWNVNGVRSVLGYSPWCHAKESERLRTMFNHLDCDILCFQETKINRDQLSADLAKVDGYITFYSFCNARNGYSGVATYVRQTETLAHIAPIKAQDGFTGLLKNNDADNLVTTAELLSMLRQEFDDTLLRALDNEGRCLITDHAQFVLLNIYFPNGHRSEERTIFKARYHECIQIVLRYLIRVQKRNVLLVGDLNAKYQLCDSCDPGPAQQFFASHSVQWFKQILDEVGMIDTFKRHHPDFTSLPKKPYTCWDSYTFARASNYGTRIDYILVSQAWVEGEDKDDSKEKEKKTVQIVDAKVMQSVMGSDHCPVFCELTSAVGNQTSIPPVIPKLASRFMPEFAGKQTKLMSFFAKSKNGKTNDIANTKNRKRKRDPIETETETKTATAKDNECGPQRKRTKHEHVKPDTKSRDKTQSNLWSFVSKKQATSTTSTANSDSDQQTKNKAPKEAESTTSTTSSSSLCAAEQWKNLFSNKPKIPKCHHDEACVLRTVIKEGLNRGKKFYACKHGKGQANDPNAQCGFFKWLDAPAKLKQTSSNGNQRNHKTKSW